MPSQAQAQHPLEGAYNPLSKCSASPSKWVDIISKELKKHHIVP